MHRLHEAEPHMKALSTHRLVEPTDTPNNNDDDENSHNVHAHAKKFACFICFNSYCKSLR